MKLCPYCSAQLADDAQFCMCCGSSVANVPAPAAPAAPVYEAPAAPVYEAPAAPVFEAPAAPAAPVFEAPAAPAYQAPAYQAPTYPTYDLPVADPQPKKKKGKGGKVAIILIIILALIGGAVAVVGFMTDWSFDLFGGPLSALSKAYQKTMNAGSYTLEKEVTLEIDGSKASTESEIEFVKDFATITIYDDGEKVVEYNGKIYSIDADDEYANIEDINKDTEEDDDDEDDTVYYDIYSLYFDMIKGEEITDEQLEGLSKELNIKADADELRDFMEQVIQKECLNNEEWLADILGFEKKDNKYTFEFKEKKLIADFCDRAVEFGIMKKSEKKDITAEESVYKYTLEFVVENGYVVKYEYLMEGETISLSTYFKYTKINETKIDQDDVDDIVDEVEAFIDANYDTCLYCNELVHKDSVYEISSNTACYDCYRKDHECDKCGYITSSSYICYNHYEYGYCDDCGRYRSLDYYNVKTKEMLCYYCY